MGRAMHRNTTTADHRSADPRSIAADERDPLVKQNSASFWLLEVGFSKFLGAASARRH
jgi:hypothetical protein